MNKKWFKTKIKKKIENILEENKNQNNIPKHGTTWR